MFSVIRWLVMKFNIFVKICVFVVFDKSVCSDVVFDSLFLVMVDFFRL